MEPVVSKNANGAAHTDIMDNSEQVFDEPVVWRQSAQRDPRVKIRSDGNSLLDSQLCSAKSRFSGTRSSFLRSTGRPELAGLGWKPMRNREKQAIRGHFGSDL